MTVEHLIKLLQRLPKHEKVMISSDAEGNEYNEVDRILATLDEKSKARIFIIYPKHRGIK